VPIGIIPPIQAIGAFAQERENQNLEAILLTSMRPRQIVFGKWCSLYFLSVLLTVSAVPYAVTRYFLGGFDLVNELLLLCFLLLWAGVFTMAGLGISLYCGRVMRFLAMGGAFLLLWLFWGRYILAANFSTGMRDFVDGPVGWALFVTGCLLMFLTLLEAGAARVGALTENYSTRQRLLIIGFAAYLIACVSLDLNKSFAFVLQLFSILMLALIQVEPIARATSVYRPFVRLGFFGRAMGRLLYPGWASGFWFTLVLVTVIGAVAALNFVPEGAELNKTIHLFLAIIGTLFLPGLIYQLISKKVKIPGEALLLLVHSLQAVMAIALMTIGSSSASGMAGGLIRGIAAFLPTTQLFAAMEYNWSDKYPESTFTLMIVDAICLLLLCLLSIQAFRKQIAPLERRVMQTTAAPTTPPVAPPVLAQPEV